MNKERTIPMSVNDIKKDMKERHASTNANVADAYDRLLNHYFDNRVSEEDDQKHAESNREAMRERIPQNSVYCHGRDFNVCPWWHGLGITVMHRDIKKAEGIAKKKRENGEKVYAVKACDSTSCKRDCWQEPSTKCRYNVTRCDYLDITDENEQTLLWDQCKVCDEGYGDEY